MSFGAPAVDEHNVIQDFPATSMLVGLLANALGYDHGEHERLQALQDRLRWAARCDRRGQPLRDFQTVDLGQPHLVGTGWTTLGRREDRAGAKSTSEGTHIRYRDYHADAAYAVALVLEPAGAAPTLADVDAALRAPARPLFLGRKCCLPSGPLRLGRVAAPSLLEAVRAAPLAARARPAEDGRYPAWWPEAEAAPEWPSRLLPVWDERDWANQVHTGRRLVRAGLVAVLEDADHA